MMSTMRTTVFPILLSICANLACSLLAVWIVSALFDFTFRPSVVAALSASVSGAAIAAALLRHAGDRTE